MFFKRVKNLKESKCSQMGNLSNKLRYICMIEWYSSIKLWCREVVDDLKKIFTMICKGKK